MQLFKMIFCNYNDNHIKLIAAGITPFPQPDGVSFPTSSVSESAAKCTVQMNPSPKPTCRLKHVVVLLYVYIAV